MEKKYYIYKHINKINGKIYIGQTNQDPERRWRPDGSGYKIKEAAQWAGLNSVSGIGQCCRGERNVSGIHPETGEKLHWKYVKGVS